MSQKPLKKGIIFLTQSEKKKELTRMSILRLKQVKLENGYTNQQIVDMVWDKGMSISEKTVQKVFAEGSENVNFNYNLSIKPLNIAMLDITDTAIVPPPNASKAEKDIAALKNIVLIKGSQIDELTDTIGELEAKIEEEKASAQRRIDFLKEQISVKDAQIAQKEAAISQKERAIGGLVFTLISLLIIIIAALIVDRINPNLGYFWRGMSALISGDGNVLSGHDVQGTVDVLLTYIIGARP